MPRQIVRNAVACINPFDDLELEHQQDVLGWIDSDAPIFRISKPDNPRKHLVSYFVLFDEATNRIMLIDHIKSNSWLPPGGHIDPDEDPRNTAIREAKEELGIDASFDTKFGNNPLFVTVTVTKGCNFHTDVSLWYVIRGNSKQELEFDTNEIRGYKWLSPEEILAMDIGRLDPHMHRFIQKAQAELQKHKQTRDKIAYFMPRYENAPDLGAGNPDHLPEINRIIASVIIFSQDGKMLMGRKDPNKGGVYASAWHIPGGGIEDGETLEDAARREAQQEVDGLDLNGTKLAPLPFIGHGESPKTLPNGKKVWCKMEFHRFEIRLDKTASELQKVLKPGDDLAELQWFDTDELEQIEHIPGGAEFFVEAGYMSKSKD